MLEENAGETMVEIPVGGWAFQYMDEYQSGDVYSAKGKHLGRLTKEECNALAKGKRRKRGSFPATVQGVDGWVDVFVMGDYGNFTKWRDKAAQWNEAHAET
jgi:hypothetical protein